MKRIPFIVQFKWENPSDEELRMTDIICNAVYNYETLARRRLVRWFLATILLALVAIAGVGYVGWKSTMDERVIIAELERQVGKTSPTLGYKEVLVLNKDGRWIWNKKSQSYATTTVPVGIWDVLEAQQRLIERDERHLWPFIINSVDQNEVLAAINITEAQLLGNDRFWDAVRVELLEKDSDGDGIKNVVDDCVDVPGKPYNSDSGYWYEGCPPNHETADRDNDDIADYRDACPDETGDGIRRDLGVITGPRSGFGANTGCLNTDDDYVVDRDDLCPTVASRGDDNYDGCTDADTDVTPFLAKEGIVSFEGFRLDDKTVKAYWATRRIDRYGEGWSSHIACVPHGADGAVTTAIPADGTVQPPSVSNCRAVASIPDLPATAAP